MLWLRLMKIGAIKGEVVEDGKAMCGHRPIPQLSCTSSVVSDQRPHYRVTFFFWAFRAVLVFVLFSN